MNQTLKRIIVTLCLAILLPIGIYVVYEVNTLTENEKELKVIYERQLEAVLFSVNLYTQDLMNSVAFQLETAQNDSLEAQQLLQEHPYFEAITFITSDSAGHKSQTRIFKNIPLAQEEQVLWENSLSTLIQKEDSIFTQLQALSQKGFRKLQPLPNMQIATQGYSSIGFVRSKAQPSDFCIIFIRTDPFIDQVVAQKLQQAGQEECEMLVRKKLDNTISYTTDSTSTDLIVTKSMWLFPDYELGVSASGKTLYEIIQQRAWLNIGSLLLLVIFIGMGVWFMFKSIKKDMEVAQHKSEFVSNVSHEIRTPLALISMFAETLSLGRVRSEERKQEYYDIILKETSRLTNLVNRILNFSQIEANKRQYQLEKVDLSQIARDMLETYSYHIESKGFSLQFNQGHHENLFISGDFEAVSEAIVNLLENALKYSLEEKEIRVQLGTTGQFHFVEVIDKGMGIPKAQIGQIFDKFYRVPQGDVHTTKGSGLGLSIVKHIMDAHQGKIEIESIPEQGSTFRLCFPIQTEIG